MPQRRRTEKEKTTARTLLFLDRVLKHAEESARFARPQTLPRKSDTGERHGTMLEQVHKKLDQASVLCKTLPQARRRTQVDRAAMLANIKGELIRLDKPTEGSISCLYNLLQWILVANATALVAREATQQKKS